MLKKLAGTIFLFATITACNNNDDKKPEQMSEINVATAFVRDLLDNKLDEAETFILKDEENKQFFDAFRQDYGKKNKAELEKYRSADIIINETSYVTDSVCIVNYSNTVNRELKNKVKVVRVNGKWQIDLKYTFSGNM